MYDSPIQSHFRNTGHHPNADNFKIIDRGDSEYVTQIKEAIHISVSKPSLNSQIERPILAILQ